jgi:integrase/recombinase XerD
MTKLPLKYVHAFRDRRHGKLRHYFRRRGSKQIPLPGLPGSTEFMEAYQAALGVTPREIGASRTQPGTVNAAIVGYYQSPAFRDLAPSTRAMRRAILERFRLDHGDKRIATMPRDFIAWMLSRMKPFAQRNWLKSLRGLMRFVVVDARLRPDDPTREIELRTAHTGGHITWAADHVAQYRKRHALGTVARVAIELMLNVAARRGDAYQLGRQHVVIGDDGVKRLSWRPSKTRRKTARLITVRILPELQAAIDAIPARDALTFLTNDYCRPFASAAAFGNKFADWCNQAGLVGIVGDEGRTRNFRAHGLRKASLVRLAEAGATGPELMSVSGHSTLAQVQIYIEEADRTRMADTAMLKLSRIETETEIGKPSDPRWQTGK